MNVKTVQISLILFGNFFQKISGPSSSGTSRTFRVLRTAGLTISCREGTGIPRGPRAQLANVEGLPLLFLAEEGRGALANPEFQLRL